MKSPLAYLTGLAVIAFSLGSANAQFSQLWLLGDIDGGMAEFSQENGPQSAPGSPTAFDDDYYFAGDYGGAIGVVALDEDWLNVDRAIASNDMTNRLHFILDPVQAHPMSELRFTMNLVGLGWWDSAAAASGAGPGVHDVEILFNGTLVSQQTGLVADTLVQETFTAAAATAVTGENIIEITRTGGDSAGNGGASGWIQHDYVQLDVDISNVPCVDPICTYSSSAVQVTPGGSVTLSWLTDPSAALTIDSGVGSVDAATTNGVGSVVVNPTVNTTYTLTSVRGADTQTESVTVLVELVNSFASDVTETTPGAPTALLSWEVDPDPAVTVSIDNGVGDVTAQTIGGMGSIAVSPSANTTYTITATRPNSPADDVVTATVSVEWNPFASLWVIGLVDDAHAEFSQEQGPDLPPGSPTAHDDDYFLAGDYGGAIGVVAADEPWINFDRAVTEWDTTNRIHFILDTFQAAPSTELRFSFDMRGGGWWDAVAMASGGTFGEHDLAISVNGNQISTHTGITEPVLIREAVTAGSVGVMPGENIVEITRTGGDSAGDGSSSGWIQIDYVEAEIFASDPVAFLITDYIYDPGASTLGVTFPSASGQSFFIDTSIDCVNWEEYDDGVPAAAGANETNYTVDIPVPAPEKFFIRARLQ